MPLLSSIFGRREMLAAKRGPYTMSQVAGMGWVTGPESASGRRVDEEDALSLSAVFAAVNLLSRVVGALPCSVYRSLPGGGKEVALDNPVHRLLKIQANPEMTAATASRTFDFHRLLWGNGYQEIGWDGMGNPAALWPVEPWRVQPKRDEAGDLYYLIDGVRRVDPADMLHVPLVSFDGVCGRSFVEFALDSLGLGLSAQEFAAKFFGNGARPGGLLINKGNPTKPQRDEVKRGWDESHRGAAQAHKTGVLWGGWEFDREAGAVNPGDAQLLETRKFTTEEVARWLNIPPHLLRELSRATFSNIEAQGIDFIIYSIGPTLVDYEQERDRKLLNPPGEFCKHNVAALLRGDSVARADYYTKLFTIGVFSVNDIQELEDRNPVKGGDVRFVPLNMQPLESALVPVDDTEPDGIVPAGEEVVPAGGPADAKAAAKSGDVQASALNGAQITSLIMLTDKLAAQEYPGTAVEAEMQASFPLMDRALISTIVKSIEEFAKANPPKPAPAPSFGGPPQGPPANSPPAKPPVKDGMDPEAQSVCRDWIGQTLSRLARVEANAARRAAEKPGKFLDWLEEFRPKHQANLAEALGSIFRGRHWLGQAANVTAHAERWASTSHAALLDVSGLATSEQLPGAVESLVSKWDTERAEKFTRELMGV